MGRWRQQSLPKRVLRGVFLALVLCVLVAFVPTPYVLHGPGRANPVRPMVAIHDGKVYPSEGEFLLPTVLEEPASVLYCIYALLDPQANLTRGSSKGEQAQSPTPRFGPTDQMAASQYTAALVALTELGYTIESHCIGLRVNSLFADSPNQGRLQPGDRITEAGGTKIDSYLAFHNVSGEADPDAPFPVTVVRDGEEQTVDLELFQPDGRNRIGVLLQAVYQREKLPLDIRFTNGRTVGASGGLVFSLEIYDQLTEKDLTGGRKIAATGVLDPDGKVRKIEGASYKLVAADRAGAEVFLVPRDNWAELRNVDTSVEIIPVDNFQQALEALQPESGAAPSP